MTNISIFTIKQVKEKTARYELEDAIIRSPKDAVEIIKLVLEIHLEASEKFGIITLNTKNKVAGLHVLSMGSLNTSIVHPREVFKNAILNNAASIICFHNHPSGDTTPSQEDIVLTERLVEAGELMGIEVLDHVIVGDEAFCSLKEQGFI